MSPLHSQVLTSSAPPSTTARVIDIHPLSSWRIFSIIVGAIAILPICNLFTTLRSLKIVHGTIQEIAALCGGKL